ncbi:NADH-quinone oxidoreductase subunit D [Myxococcota bacterium]|nr:NADH-quinone oxidoreductase subunit D [Myxococcota bacterium]
MTLEPLREPKHEQMLLNMGPQHPSTHGVINLLVESDGEVITRAIPEVGYLHRSIEKIGERVTYNGFMPYTDRVDYVAAMTANEGYAMAVERLLGVADKIPRRALYCRVVASELCRIASHHVGTGTMVMDIGGVTPFLWWLREREIINNFMEELCGARLTYNYMRIGGVMADLPPGFDRRVLRWLDHFEPMIDEFNRTASSNKIYIERLANLGIVSKEMAIGWGLVGPNLRASGVKFDVRKNLPYSVYPEFEFDVPVGQGWVGTVGDSYDRYYVRVLELKQSCRILRQALEGMPEGDYMAKMPRKIKPAVDEAYAAVEAARGEMGYYVVSDGKENAYRVKVRTGSFTATQIMEPLSHGVMIADLVALFASMDVVAPELDR